MKLFCTNKSDLFDYRRMGVLVSISREGIEKRNKSFYFVLVTVLSIFLLSNLYGKN